MPGQITQHNIQRVLIVGFSLVILLLVAAGFVGVFNVQSIRLSATSLVTEQRVTTRLIDEIQREQSALSAVFHRLAHDPDTVDPDRILAQIDEADTAIQKTVASAEGTPEGALWRDLKRAAEGFSDEARSFIDQRPDEPGLTHKLVQEHDAVISITSKLISASYQRANVAEQRIETHSRDLARQSSFLLGACVLLALVTTVLTVRTTKGLFARMEWQASELSRVSWHMLDKQETVARRFSHELHDELGQAMTALKANVIALGPAPAPSEERREDCLRIIDDAIQNVRELSQLLRPTILDDFGLDASLKWLAERFSTRTGIQVDYQSSFDERLSEDTETHLFRIAQEALTNVARHSGAKRVTIGLVARSETISLRVSDDGKGLPNSGASSGGLGMIGMRARARNMGGDISIGPSAEHGVEIVVTLPLTSVEHEPKDQDFVSR